MRGFTVHYNGTPFYVSKQNVNYITIRDGKPFIQMIGPSRNDPGKCSRVPDIDESFEEVIKLYEG